jgi:hypothetical protein
MDETKHGTRVRRLAKTAGLPIETRRLRLRKHEAGDAADVVSDAAEADEWDDEFVYAALAEEWDPVRRAPGGTQGFGREVRDALRS